MGLSQKENAAAATIAEAECAVEDGIIGDVVDSADVELVKTVDGNENVDERETKSSEVNAASTTGNGVVVALPEISSKVIVIDTDGLMHNVQVPSPFVSTFVHRSVDQRRFALPPCRRSISWERFPLSRRCFGILPRLTIAGSPSILGPNGFHQMATTLCRNTALTWNPSSLFALLVLSIRPTVSRILFSGG